MYVQNVISINNKISYIKSNLKLLSTVPQIIIFTETWLQPHIESHSLGLIGYNVFRCDRKLRAGNSARGGGILIAVHHTLQSKLVFSLEGAANRNKLDTVFVEISISSTKLLLAAAYIPPSSHRQCYKKFVNILEDVSTDYLPKNIIACGDFSLSGATWSDDLSVNAVQYVVPATLENVNVLRQVALLMNWRQLFPPHISGGLYS